MKILFISLLITGLFFLLKIIEMKYILKKWEPLKFIIRDAIYVLLSSIVCILFYVNMDGSINNFLDIITNTNSNELNSIQIFTDEPGF